MKLYLVRHGQSQGNVDKTIYKTIPDNKVELTTKGRLEATNAGSVLISLVDFTKPITMYHSSWKRAKDTSILIEVSFSDVYYDIKNIECPLIHEHLYYSNSEVGSIVEYVPYEEGSDFGPFWYQKNGTNIETYSSMYHRAMTFWNHIRLSHNKTETIIVVAHGVYLKVLEMVIKQLSISDYEKLKNFDNCEIRMIEV